MLIHINGEPREVPEGASIAALLTLLGCAPEGVAVAIGMEVVPRSQREARALRPGDRVEIIQAVGGG